MQRKHTLLDCLHADKEKQRQQNQTRQRNLVCNLSLNEDLMYICAVFKMAVNFALSYK